jgi:mono/diheme cytochrome c family protein
VRNRQRLEVTRRWAAACGFVFALAAPPLAAGQPPVTVRFQGEVKAEWEVEPRARSVTVARGEIFETQVRVINRSAREVVAMVVKEVRPQEAAGALIHLGCGPTFTLVLKPGEAAAVPVSYFVADDAPREVDTFDIAYAVYSFAPHSPDPLHVGRRIYAERCANCHGVLGRGDGPTGRLLAGGVGDLTPALRQKDDRLLIQAIADGMGPMPAFAPALNDAEQQALVVYLRDLGRGAP